MPYFPFSLVRPFAFSTDVPAIAFSLDESPGSILLTRIFTDCTWFVAGVRKRQKSGELDMIHHLPSIVYWRIGC